jgi:kynurenine 3-monooxygenase
MITIVGAGLVGSLWAILLRKKGFEVEVFERRTDLRKSLASAGRSINLVITSRGLHGLETAGLQDEVTALAVSVYGRMIHTPVGEQIYQAYGQENECNLSISRDALNRFLIERAETLGVRFHFEHELRDLDVTNRRMTFAVAAATVQEATTRSVARGASTTSEASAAMPDDRVASAPRELRERPYEILFGADGAGSRVRKCLTASQSFTESTEWLEADYKELTLPLGNDGKSQLETRALHIWPRGDHMMMALANRDGSFTVTMYLPKARFADLGSASSVEALFKAEFNDAIPLMKNYVSEFLTHPQGTLGTVRSSRWVFDGSVALMGDAAHAIVPFFGQGMNCGFEDCTTLFKLLEGQSRPEDKHDWPRILSEYERIQKPNADAIADMALENWVEMRDKVGDQAFLLRKKVDGALEAKHPGLYKSRYGLITYTLVPYAVAQKAGIVQNHLLDELIGDAKSLNDISWQKADELLGTIWEPFARANGLTTEG